MSTSTTTNLGLILDNADEPVKTHHRHANENLATLDVTIKSLQDAMDNAKALLGQLGIDAEDHYAVDAETARTTLGVPSLSDIGDIVRQNIPLMSPTTLGGAKLEEHGGLVLRDEKLGIGSLVQESDGVVRGSIAGLTAEGHAEQDGTPTPDSPVPIQVVRGRNLLEYTLASLVTLNTSGTWSGNEYTYRGVTYTVNPDMSISTKGTASGGKAPFILMNLPTTEFVKEFDTSKTYYLSGCPTGGSGSSYFLRLMTVSPWTQYAIDAGNGGGTDFSNFQTSGDYVRVLIGMDSGTNTNGLTFRPQLEAGSKATPYVLYGHVGLEADANAIESGGIVAGGALVNNTARLRHKDYVPVREGSALYVSSSLSGKTMQWVIYWFDSDKRSINTPSSFAATFANDVPRGATYAKVLLRASDDSNISSANVSFSCVSTTPIPLPSRGWVAGLPDGTADTLALDGAGKVTWELKDDEVVLDGSASNDIRVYDTQGNYCVSNVVDTVIKCSIDDATIPPILASYLTATSPSNLWRNLDIIFITITMAKDTYRLRFRIPIAENTVESANAYLAAHPLTVLYPLAMPVIEECGYVDMPTIPSDATVTIPELDALGVKYFVDDSAGTLAKQWYERAQSEYADRITTLEQAVAELATS